MHKPTDTNYAKVDQSYFDNRGLKRYAGVWSLWALGVGAVISGHFSGWNLGLANGWGSMFVATVIIAIMYLGLCFSLAEMSPALPHTGGAYSFARTAMGRWGGFLTGLSENVEYVLTPAVIVYFISSYMSGIFGTGTATLPLWWVGFYVVFIGLNIVGVELSFKLTLVVTLLALTASSTISVVTCLSFFAYCIPTHARISLLGPAVTTSGDGGVEHEGVDSLNAIDFRMAGNA